MSKATKVSAIVILTVFAAIACFFGCRKHDAGEIKLGAILPLTGDAAIYGRSLKNGIELALDESLKAGKPRAKIIFEDDQYSATQSVSAVRKLLQVDKVPAIIGGAGSTTAEPVIPICDRAQVVLLSPCATAPSLSGSSRFFFRLWPSDTYDGSIMAETAYDTLKARKVAILYVNAPYGAGITKVFTDRLTALGGQIGLTESYDQGATDFRAQLTKIKDARAEWIFVPGYVKELAIILVQAQELDIKGRFLGVNSMHDPKLIELAGKAAEGAVFSVPTYDPNSRDPVVRAFVTAYRAKFNDEPDAFAATGYDALRVMLEAIRLSNATSGPAIRQGMTMVKAFPGAGGPVSFDENGDVQKPLRLMTIRNGRFAVFDKLQ